MKGSVSVWESGPVGPDQRLGSPESITSGPDAGSSPRRDLDKGDVSSHVRREPYPWPAPDPWRPRLRRHGTRCRLSADGPVPPTDCLVDRGYRPRDRVFRPGVPYPALVPRRTRVPHGRRFRACDACCFPYGVAGRPRRLTHPLSATSQGWAWRCSTCLLATWPGGLESRKRCGASFVSCGSLSEGCWR